MRDAAGTLPPDTPPVGWPLTPGTRAAHASERDGGTPPPDHTPTDTPASTREPQMTRRRLEGAAVWVLGEISRRRWGFRPSILPDIVEHLGPIRGARWLARSAGVYDSTSRALGSVRTHLVCMTVSQLNGDSYSAYGHAYAMELIYLRRYDRLFPVDAEAMAGWAGLPRAELRGRLRDALNGTDLQVELMWVDRTLAFVEGSQPPIDEDERRVAQLVDIANIFNAISVATRPPHDQAFSPINKDVRLKTRLAALRAAKNS